MLELIASVFTVPKLTQYRRKAKHALWELGLAPTMRCVHCVCTESILAQ